MSSSPALLSSSLFARPGGKGRSSLLVGRSPPTAPLLVAPSRAPPPRGGRGASTAVVALWRKGGGDKTPPAFRCLQCNTGNKTAKKCVKCGNADINRFAYAQRCSLCRGGREVACYKCNGMREIVKYKGIINRQEVGSTPCTVCNATGGLPCGQCKGLGSVYYRSSDWR